MIEGSCNNISASSLRQVTIIPSLVTIGIAAVKIFLVCLVIHQNFVIKDTCHLSTEVPGSRIILWVRATQSKSQFCHVWWAWTLWYQSIMSLVCHVTLQEPMINGSCDFLVEANQGKLTSCQMWWPWALW